MLLFSRIPFPVILFILSSLPFLPFTISYPLSCLLLSSLRLSYYPPLSSLPSLILFLVSPHFPYYLISYLILSLISSYPLFVHPLLPSFLSATTTGHGRIVTDRTSCHQALQDCLHYTHSSTSTTLPLRLSGGTQV